ncbi:MAG TPA: hypothetical protein VGM76_10775 [Lacipirellulaceae bacterium]
MSDWLYTILASMRDRWLRERVRMSLLRGFGSGVERFPWVETHD